MIESTGVDQELTGEEEEDVDEEDGFLGFAPGTKVADASKLQILTLNNIKRITLENSETNYASKPAPSLLNIVEAVRGSQKIDANTSTLLEQLQLQNLPFRRGSTFKKITSDQSDYLLIKKHIKFMKRKE